MSSTPCLLSSASGFRERLPRRPFWRRFGRPRPAAPDTAPPPSATPWVQRRAKGKRANRPLTGFARSAKGRQHSIYRRNPMPLSLHAALVPSWLQILGTGRGWLDKAAGCGLAEAELVEGRLADDMFGFNYQVKSMAAHSKGAIEAVRAGVFTPNFQEALPQSM